ncbi:MAG: phosphatidylglycerophosphatase A [Planctomycetota bacterium]
MTRLDRILGTVLGAGASPIMPGTCGSLVALLVAIVLPERGYAFSCAALAAAATFGGLPVASRFIAGTGRKDPQDFVLDEAAGQWIACWRPTPPSLLGFALAFLLFRLFDMTKWGPVGRAERLPGARGVVYDDVVAGLIALPLSWGLEFAILQLV